METEEEIRKRVERHIDILDELLCTGGINKKDHAYAVMDLLETLANHKKENE